MQRINFVRKKGGYSFIWPEGWYKIKKEGGKIGRRGRGIRLVKRKRFDQIPFCRFLIELERASFLDCLFMQLTPLGSGHFPPACVGVSACPCASFPFSQMPLTVPPSTPSFLLTPIKFPLFPPSFILPFSLWLKA